MGKLSPYRSQLSNLPTWEDYFEDYALAFGLCADPPTAFWMDPPEYEQAARYADLHAKGNYRFG